MENQYYRRAKPHFSLGRFLRKQFRRPAVLLAVGLGVPALMFMMFSPRGILQRMALSSEKQAMAEKLHQAQLENQRLQQESHALDTDPKAQEKVAREKFGMIKEGETVYKVRKER